MMFDTNKVFRIHFKAGASSEPATRSIVGLKQTLQFMRHVLDQSGAITNIKYDGQNVAPVAQQELLAKARQMKWKKTEGRPSLVRSSRKPSLISER